MLFYKTYFWQPRISEILAEKYHETIEKSVRIKISASKNQIWLKILTFQKGQRLQNLRFVKFLAQWFAGPFWNFSVWKFFVWNFFLKIFVSKQNRQFSKFSSNLFLKIFTRQNFVHSVLFWYSAALVLFNPQWATLNRTG